MPSDLDRQLAMALRGNALDEASRPYFMAQMSKLLGAYLRGELDTSARNVAAYTAGLPGDFRQILELPYKGVSVFDESDLPTSEEFLERLGGDPEHWSNLPAMLAAPGPGEAVSGGKALMAGLKGLGEYTPTLAAALFHGTPHKFSKFDLDKVGSGLGGSKIGYGMSFHEDPSVADSVRKTLVTGNIEQGHIYEIKISDNSEKMLLDWEKPLSEQPKAIQDAANEAFGVLPQVAVRGTKQYEAFVEPVHVDDLLEMQGNRLGKTDLEKLKAEINEAGGLKEPVIIQVGKQDRSTIVGEGNHRVQAAKELGYNYVPARVLVQRETHGTFKNYWPDITPKADEYFKSDAKPSEVFRNVRVSSFEENAKGIEIYRSLSENLGGRKQASEALRESGIVGIRESFNDSPAEVLLFNPDDITQVKRDGEVVFTRSIRDGNYTTNR